MSSSDEAVSGTASPASDPGQADEGGRWVALGRSLVEQVMGAAVVTVALSMTALVFNDFILPPPDLNGGWKYTELTEPGATTNSSFYGLQATYKVLLIQDGLNVSGTGEKVSDKLPGKEAYEFTPDQKKKLGIEVSGYIERKFFSRDVLVLHINNQGAKRLTSTLHQVKHFSETTMSGCFKTTAASASGPARWERIDWRPGKFDNMPLETPDSCYADS